MTESSAKNAARLTVLHEIEAAIRRETHVLQAQPDLAWQQLCNRLQWSDGPVQDLVAAEADQRTADTDGPIWFRTRTPFREAEVLLRTLRAGGVRACALAPNGAWLSTVDGSVRLWDTRTGIELAKADDRDDSVMSCAFDCDGNFLVTGSRAGTVCIRDGRTLTELVELHANGGAAYCATSPVEPLAVIASGTVLRLVELPSGRERVASSVEGGAFSCCAFSNGGEGIATGDEEGTLTLWSAETLHEQGRVTGLQGPIKACAVSPNAAFVAGVPARSAEVLLVGGPDETGKPQTMTLRAFDTVNDCCVSPDGRWLASACDDHMTWLRDLEDVTRASALEGHSAPVLRCTFAANGSLLATVGQDDSVKLWDPWRGPSKGGIAGHRDRVSAVAFAPDGSFVVSASADMTLKTWDPAPTTERRTLAGHLGEVWDCAVLQGSRQIASAAGDGTIRLWDVDSAQETQVLHVGYLADVHALACSPDGSLLAVGHDRSVSLWDVATAQRTSEGHIVEVGSGDRRVQDCAFTPDGGRLLVACEDATLRLWDVAAWHELTVLRGHTDVVSCCACVPESSFAVSGSRDGTLRLWDLDSKEELHVFAEHTDAVWDCAVSADGAVMVSAGWDGNLRIWHLGSRTPIATFSVPVRLRSVALHPSEPRLACGDMDGWLRVVDVMGLHPRAPGPPAGGNNPYAALESRRG